MNNFPLQKKLLFSVIIFALIVIPFHKTNAFWPFDSLANTVITAIQTVLLAGPYAMLWIFTGLAVGLAYLAMYVLDSAMNPLIYTAVMTTPAIDKGWTVMRDTANLFFILILIFIALATTLRLHSYSAKTWIPKLLFAALFINFSKIITLFIIDIGNMFMYAASSWIGTSIGGSGIQTLADFTLKIFIDVNPISEVITKGITVTSIVNIGVIFLFNVILALTILALAIFLVIRIAMLAILTIFSPIAFMLFGWPGGSKYASQWWGSLLKYIIFGPIFVFFLFIASEMAYSLFTMGTIVSPPTCSAIGPLDVCGLTYLLGLTIPYIIVIMMLLCSLSFTKDMGIMGAGMIMGAVTGLAGATAVYAGYKTVKPFVNKIRNATGFAKGGWDAYRNKTLRQWGKDGIKGKYLGVDPFTMKPIYEGGLKNKMKGMPKAYLKEFGGTIASPFHDVKDLYTITKNKMSRESIDKMLKTLLLLNLTKSEAVKRLDDPNNSREDKAALLEYLSTKKVDDPAHLEKIARHMESVTGANIDKKKVAEAFPMQTAALKDIREPVAAEKENFKQLSDMYDEGTLNRMAPAAYSKKVLEMLEEIIPDPKELDRLIEHRGAETRKIIKENYIDMLTDPQNMKDGFNMANKQGNKNFFRGSRVIREQGKGIEDIYKEYDASGRATGNIDTSAVKRFAQENYKNFGDIKEDGELRILVRHNAIDTPIASHIRAENLDPYKCKVIWEEVKSQYNANGGAGNPANPYKDVYVYMENNTLWGKK